MAKAIFDPKNIALSRRAATEGIILLKNEGAVLPLDEKAPIALFGRNQIDTYKGGGGAADVWMVDVLPFADGLEAAANVYAPLLARYRAFARANHNATAYHARGDHPWSLPEYPLTDAEISDAAAACETAVFFLGRFSNESYDINDEAGEYRIKDDELSLLLRVRRRFEKLVLVLNLPGLMDLSFLDACAPDAIVHTYMSGMEAGNALADILLGKVSPSGKLPDSWAKTLAEYPTNEGFATEHIVYREGLYMGYRYFDTFSKDVLFPFGFGLSYTEFSYGKPTVSAQGTRVSVLLDIENIGAYSGREVVQCYLSVPDGRLEQPYQVLCGFEKTALLAPSQAERVRLEFDLSDFTSYCEECESYLLEGGNYVVRVGRHSRDTVEACVLNIPETTVFRKVENRMARVEDIELLRKPCKTVYATDGLPVIDIDLSGVQTYTAPEFVPAQELVPTEPCTFADVVSGRRTAEELVACIPDAELAYLMSGDGPKKIDKNGKLCLPLFEGEGSHSHPIPELGIPSSSMQDGPAGMRLSHMKNILYPEDEINGRDCICYPCSTLVAAAWDRELARRIGEAIAEDIDRYTFHGWCAPGVNLHRNPLCGRNFEYFSEDPYLAAEMAIAQIAGIQETRDGTPTRRYATLKHFACNESERYRKDSNSVIDERTARELHLRTFDLIIHKKAPLAVMTSYNLINGSFASAHKGLLDGILRTEWGYEGWVMTDWHLHVGAPECIAAGADIVMPEDNFSYEEMIAHGADRATMQRRAVNTVKHLLRTRNLLVK